MATVAELLLAKGQQQANARQRQGAVSGALVATLGHVAAQGMEGYQQAKHAEAEQALFSGPDLPTPQQVLQVYGPERGAKVLQGLQAFHEIQGKQVTDARDTAGRLAIGVKALGPDQAAKLWPTIRQAAIQGGLGSEQEIPPEPSSQYLDAVIGWATGKQADAPKAPGTRAVTIKHPDGSETTKIVEDTPGQDFSSAAPEPKPAPLTYGAPQTMTVDGRREIVRAGSDGQMYLVRTGKAVANVQPEAETPKAPGSLEQQIADALARGDQSTVDRLTRAAELASGARARTQGRPVTSGDAGRLSDYDTSLSDLARLSVSLKGTEGATGTSAKIGASLPNVVSNITGLGIESKKRQALIDQVKQVIGKALEGGVLRKEDEVKYEKILPTIGDPPAVAAEKLTNLGIAIRQARQNKLDALQDAGYDISKFSARTEERAQAAPAPANVLKALQSVGQGRHTLSDGSVWNKAADGTIQKAN